MKKEKKLLLCVVASIVLLTARHSGAATFVVTNAIDGAPGSLRIVLNEASTGDVITFATNLSGGMITLQEGGEIIPRYALTITATNLPGGITIRGNSLSRLFTVTNGVSLTLSGLNLTGGGGSSSINAKNNCGGAIYANGNLTMTACNIYRNSSTDFAGAIYVDTDGRASLTQCALYDNNSNEGGATYVDGFMNGSIIFSQCAIYNNTASNESVATLIGHASFYNCTITGNSTTGGYTFFNNGNLTLVNCRFKGN